MMCVYSLVAVAAFFFPVPSYAAQCEGRAISLPLKNQRLGDGGQAYMRGVSLGIGSPEQEVSFTLSAAWRNTYAHGGEGFCEGSHKPYTCLISNGGQYNQSLSTTARSSLVPIASLIDEGVDANWTSDSITLENGAAFHDWRFGTRSRAKGQAAIGVGVNSTFINALRTAGNISSNAYSLFWGDEFTDEPRDGAFTLGGYDEAILGDSMVTKGFTRSEEHCDEGMIVKVTHMRLNHEDGSIVNLLDGLGALNVCVIPALRAVMAVPRAYGEKMVASMGAVRIDNGKNLAPSTKYGLRLMPNTTLLEPDSATFKGNLSVTLQDNLTVTFTDEQLLVRRGDPYLDGQGATQYNASRVGLTVLSMEEDDSKDFMPRLGGMFFSSAYLVVNHDKSEFTIASVRKEAIEETLVGVDTANDCVAYLNGTVPGKTVQSSSPQDPKDFGDAASSPQDPEDSGNTTSSLSTGAIVGIAVGAALAVAFLAVVAFLLWRRRSRGDALVAQQHTALTEAPANSPYIFEKKGEEIHEAPDQRAVLKMSDDERDYAVELDGNAQPSELPDRTQMGPR